MTPTITPQLEELELIEYCSFPTTSSSPVPWTNELNLKQGDSPLHFEAVNWTAGQTQVTYTLPN